MSVRVVVGAQWGDEGKGKIVDLLGAEADYVVRYQGGANAGHTLVFDDTKIVLHLIPSGIFHQQAKCIIANGVVVDPLALVDEIAEVEESSLTLLDRLYISESAHVILPYHKLLDTSKEEMKGDNAIGTTGRGIGPAYIDKVARTGIRMGDLLHKEVLSQKLDTKIEEVNALFKHIYHCSPVDKDELLEQLHSSAQTLEPYITNTSKMLHEAIDTNKNILLEGAQGSLLDIDHGTFPYVTSSSPTAGGACTGSGIAPMHITDVAGITKAYCTRVGNGPFPTELDNQEGELLRERGGEFGATTGRPRRCGWLDLVALKYVTQINGLSELVLTKIDVLADFEEIKVCTSYLIDGEEVTSFPISTDLVERAKPQYRTFNGWNDDLSGCQKRADLPQAAETYLAFIEAYLGVSISILSIGPKRSQTLIFR